MDPHEVKAIHRLGAAVLSTFVQDRVRILSAALRGKRAVRLDGSSVRIGSISAEISATRRYMYSRDFRDVCELAGVEIRVEPAIANMLRMARIFDGGRKGVTAELALIAWEAE